MSMDRNQADAVAQAILEPHVREQQARGEALAAKRAEEALRQRRKRRAAWFALAGWGIGLLVARVCGFPLLQGTVWGGLSGALIGLMVTRRMGRGPSAQP